ncbi:MAG: peptide ABC transporter substrate-binding protein [Leptothrix sp. (in: Bacteria)]|jgi:peptide/nickel transport system substrate-binding protein|nr:peptide ABC transporter substrate-binding protein [Leptothrix sp. (in: b-proteobacteria)]
MDKHESNIRHLINEVRDGKLPRRNFISQMVGLGLTAPMAGMLLMHAGVANAQTTIPYKGTKRGGGGTLKLIYWQAAVHLNPHFAGGTKDQDASRIFYEPLAGWDTEGNLVLALGAEIPSKENGGLSADGRSVTWKLKKGVTWHDGKPFTADDVVFTAQYAGDPTTSTVTVATYKDLKVEKIDSHTVKITYPKATPFWAEALTGIFGCILPKHVFEGFTGAKSREAAANTKPVGTGPYKIVDFKPGDSLVAEANMAYHVPNQPFFDRLEIKGGGDALSAARAVLQTAEYDLAWNLAVEDELLKRLEGAGKGRMEFYAGSDIEFVSLNVTDPWKEVDGERASAKSKHPAFTDKAVREAMSLLVDRKNIGEQIYGRGAVVTSNFLNNPPRFRSPNTKYEFNIDKANQVLEAAGWKKGADGIRAKGDVKLKFVFQTSVSGPRQKCQAIIKDACTKAGIDLELKSVVAAVFFGSDAANPDTYQKFWADMQMFTTTMGSPDPQVFMEQFTTAQLSQKANKWSSRNLARWSNAEFDAAHAAAQVEFDPVKRAALFIKMNDLVVNDKHIIPLFARPRPFGILNKLRPVLSAWDNATWSIGYWTRDA